MKEKTAVSHPVRGERSSKAHTKTISATTPELFGPVVGEPWPELKSEDVAWPDDNGIGINYASKKRSMSVKVQFSSRTLLLILFAGVLVYGLARNDKALVDKVLGMMDAHAQTQSITESPPSTIHKTHRNRSSSHGKK